MKISIEQDWHVHDSGSHDGSALPVDFAKAALSRGIKSIAITNHVELFDPVSGKYDVIAHRDIPRLERVKKNIDEARKIVPEVEILFGIEVENNPPCYPDMEEILAYFDFDLVIGSIHIVDGVPISASSCRDFLRKNRPEVIYKKYYEEMARFVEWGRFDVLGHPDIVKRYCVEVYPSFKPIYPEELLKSIFQKLASCEKGVEVNTSGCFQAPATPYPSIELIELALKCGVTYFTIGSDAHKPFDIGRGYKGITALLAHI